MLPPHEGQQKMCTISTTDLHLGGGDSITLLGNVADYLECSRLSGMWQIIWFST